MSQPGTRGRPVVVALADASDVELVGTKAARLQELLRAGFPVPDGVVLTTAAAGDPAWAEALRAAAACLGSGELAVRSSAVAEDLAAASFAGLYETVLDVAPEGLEAAVRRVWASADAAPVRGYAGTELAAARPSIAVLVQRLVDARASGVALGADPLTGGRDEVVVLAVQGRGEALVRGQAGGDEWRVGGGRVLCRRAPQQATRRPRRSQIWSDVSSSGQAYRRTWSGPLAPTGRCRSFRPGR